MRERYFWVIMRGRTIYWGPYTYATALLRWEKLSYPCGCNDPNCKERINEFELRPI